MFVAVTHHECHFSDRSGADFFLGGLGPCKGPKSLGTLGKEKREKKGEGKILLSVQDSSTVSDFASDVVMNMHENLLSKSNL